MTDLNEYECEMLDAMLEAFGIPDSLTRDQLLSAAKAGERSWRVPTTRAPLKMLPFTAITDERYTTYLNVTA